MSINHISQPLFEALDHCLALPCGTPTKCGPNGNNYTPSPERVALWTQLEQQLKQEGYDTELIQALERVIQMTDSSF